MAGGSGQHVPNETARSPLHLSFCPLFLPCKQTRSSLLSLSLYAPCTIPDEEPAAACLFVPQTMGNQPKRFFFRRDPRREKATRNEEICFYVFVFFKQRSMEVAVQRTQIEYLWGQGVITHTNIHTLLHDMWCLCHVMSHFLWQCCPLGRPATRFP